MPDPEKDILNKNNGSPLRAANEPVEQQLADASEKEVELTTGDKEDSISITRSRASTVSEHSDHNDAADEKRAKQAAAPATLSRTTSVTPDAIIVPRANRHGLLATFSVIPEVENPYHYRRKTKWLITTTVAICAMAAPMGSAIVMPTLQDIAKDFNASSTVTNMSVAVYMLSMSIFPLWWSSFSETTGRRTIYLTSFILFVLFAILSAVATNISMLIVMRTFSGGAAASVQAVGAGTVADIWEPRERGRAMGLFYLGPLCGPLLAPIIGGVLAQELGWRSTQWFLVIYGGVTVLLIIFALPETLRAKTTKPAHPTVSACALGSRNGNGSSSEDQDLTRISTRASAAQRTKSFLSHIRRFLLDPLIVITWLRFPPVALTVYYASITFGSLYILNISIQATFARPPYNFSTLILGLLYIPGSIGYLLASLFGGRWIDQIMQREARKAGRYDDTGKLIYIPEDRMRENAWIAAVLWPGALIWYGWTAEKGIHWVVPMIANFFFGVGSMLIFALASTMLTEFMPKRASAGIAINNFVRNIFSFTGAVVAEPIIGSIGNGWIMTILGVWSLGSGLAVVWVMQRYGPRWRGRMVEALG